MLIKLSLFIGVRHLRHGHDLWHSQLVLHSRGPVAPARAGPAAAQGCRRAYRWKHGGVGPIYGHYRVVARVDLLVCRLEWLGRVGLRLQIQRSLT